MISCQGFFQQFWEKTPGRNWEKMIDLTSKLGEINDIQLNKGSKIYPQNQVMFNEQCTCIVQIMFTVITLGLLN